EDGCAHATAPAAASHTPQNTRTRSSRISVLGIAEMGRRTTSLARRYGPGWLYDEHVAAAMVQHTLGRAADQKLGEPSARERAHHHQIRFTVLLQILEDRLRGARHEPDRRRRHARFD